MPFKNQRARIVVPEGATDDEPQILIGSEIPPELVSFYSTFGGFGGYTLHAVIIYRVTNRSYAYTVVAEDNTFPSIVNHISGLVHLDAPQPVATPWIVADYADDGTSLVILLGDFIQLLGFDSIDLITGTLEADVDELDISTIDGRIDAIDSLELFAGNGIELSGGVRFAGSQDVEMEDTPARFFRGARSVFDSTNVEGWTLTNNPSIEIARSGGICLTMNRLSTNGSICNIRRSGTLVGSISVTTTTTTYNTSSDYRLKSDVEPMTDALGRVQRLRPVSFQWKQDGSSGEGFLAHEVQEVLPYAVTGEKDAVTSDPEEGVDGIIPQQIDHSALVPVLVGAVQELSARVTELERIISP